MRANARLPASPVSCCDGRTEQHARDLALAGLLGMVGFFVVVGASALLMAIAVGLASATHLPLPTTWLAAILLSCGGAIAAAARGELCN